MGSLGSRENAVAAILVVGLVAYLFLHFAEPHLSISWSYAHLHRRDVLPWVAAALVVLLPVATALAYRHPAARRPLAPLSWAHVAGASLLLFAGLLAFSRWYPQQPHAVDSAEFVIGATEPGFHYNPRWYLSIRIYRLVSALLVPPLEPTTFARSANVLVGVISLVALAGCGRRLGENRGEAAALTLLLWTSLGVLQMSIGYLDIYPVPMAATAVYLWLAFGVLEGRTRLVWPLLVVALGPFFYIGLILLAPSAVFLMFDVLRRTRRPRAVLLPSVTALVAAILATVPGHGRPLAWRAWYAEAADAASCNWGYNPESCLLPLRYMFSWKHANEMFHVLLLVDGVGLLLFLIYAVPELRRARRLLDLRVLVLASIAAAHFAYLLTLDPLFGWYSDWDAYTYPAVSVTLLGGLGFVLWGRRHPAWFGPLLGLALAAASVHALARLNAMHVDYRRHIYETPCHVNCGPVGSYYDSCRNCRWDGVLLLCECRTKNGQWRRTGTMRRCPRGLQNDDGVLRCQ